MDKETSFWSSALVTFTSAGSHLFLSFRYLFNFLLHFFFGFFFRFFVAALADLQSGVKSVRNFFFWTLRFLFNLVALGIFGRHRLLLPFLRFNCLFIIETKSKLDWTMVTTELLVMNQRVDNLDSVLLVEVRDQEVV